MKKQNVIDLMTYREDLLRNVVVAETHVAPPAEISDELKVAIEVLIDKLRSTNNGDINQ